MNVDAFGDAVPVSAFGPAHGLHGLRDLHQGCPGGCALRTPAAYDCPRGGCWFRDEDVNAALVEADEARLTALHRKKMAQGWVDPDLEDGDLAPAEVAEYREIEDRLETTQVA